MNSNNLKNLNSKQVDAVKSLGPVLVIAGAGTGKTRVLTTKIIDLLNDNVSQDEIYAFTFTNKAAKEMMARVVEKTDKLITCKISTFHSFFFKELNYYGDMLCFQFPISIIEPDEEIKIIRKIINENQLDLRDSDAAKYISNIKNHVDNKYSSLQESASVGIVFKSLQKTLRESNRMDFDDILYYYALLLEKDDFYLQETRKKFKYVLIDESQDMNLIQYEIISKLSKESKLLMLVGDIDQCIYTFRGSNYNLINRFKDEWNAKLIVLEENYRCTKTILEAANNLIDNNIDRINKKLYTNNETSFENIYRGFRTQSEESSFVSNLLIRLISLGYAYKDIAILYRNNMLANNFEKDFISKKIPYKVYGSMPFFNHKEIKSILNHYRFLFNHRDSIALSMIINYPTKRISDSELSDLNRLSESSGKPLYEVIKSDAKYSVLLQEVENLISAYKELDKLAFFDYMINSSGLIKEIAKEKGSKEKLARVYEFRNYIEELPEDNGNSLIDLVNDVYLQNTKEVDGENVSMMTIHQAKGLEFKVVILVGCNQGILPSLKSNDPNDEEERRLFYVAITRARERLFLTSSQRRFVNGKNAYYAPSNFLLEMGIK